jgi:hypothetical protein
MPPPGQSESTRPAAENNCGITQENPAPLTANPMTAPSESRLSNAEASPAEASRAHRRTVPAGPYRAVSRSPASRPAAIAREKAANPAAGIPRWAPRLSCR